LCAPSFAQQFESSTEGNKYRHSHNAINNSDSIDSPHYALWEMALESCSLRI